MSEVVTHEESREEEDEEEAVPHPAHHTSPGDSGPPAAVSLRPAETQTARGCEKPRYEMLLHRVFDSWPGGVESKWNWVEESEALRQTRGSFFFCWLCWLLVCLKQHVA